MKMQENATFDTHPNDSVQQAPPNASDTSPQSESAETCTRSPALESQPRTMQSGIVNPQSKIESPQRQLTFEQKDFICKHVAAFKTYREVAELFLAEFPDSGFTFDQVLKRIKYYACDNRTRKWRFRIIAYRDQLNHNLANRFRLGNKYERLRHLEAMFHEALQPRLKRLFWYPARRRKDDKITYRRFKVYEKDFAAAAKILALIVKELDADSLEALDDPYMVHRRYEHPREFAAEVEAFEQQDPDASRDLDKTFGTI
jgi:hypothetical protein